MGWIYCLIPKLSTKTVCPRFSTVDPNSLLYILQLDIQKISKLSNITCYSQISYLYLLSIVQVCSGGSGNKQRHLHDHGGVAPVAGQPSGHGP